MPSEVRFAVVRKLLESHGWILDRISSSHHVFVKAGKRPIVIPVHHQKVAPGYVRKIEKAFREEAS